MKVVQVMPEFGLGGAEIMCETLSLEFKKLGHEVVVVSLYDFHSVITERLEKNGIVIKYLGKKHGFDFSMFSKLRKIFKDEKPDVIHTHRYVMEYVIPASWKIRCTKIHTLHSIASKENDRFGRTLNRYFYKYCKVAPVALSELVQNTIVEEYRIKKDCIPIIYNGVSFTNKLVKKNYSIFNEIKLIHVGRFTAAKNHSEILEAVKILRDEGYKIHLNLVGTGELKSCIDEMIEERGLSSCVSCVGETDKVDYYMISSDIFILPSTFEGLPMTIIEAMGSAMPILASNVGGIPNLIENNMTGLLCKPEASDIARLLKILISDESLRKRLALNALNESKKYSAEIMARNYERQYLCRKGNAI